MAPERDEQRSSLENQIWELRGEYFQDKYEGNVPAAIKKMEMLAAAYGMLEGNEVAQALSLELLARDHLEVKDIYGARKAASRALEIDKRYIGMDLPYYPLHLALMADIQEQEGNPDLAAQTRKEALERMMAILRGDRIEGVRKRGYRFYDPQLDREHMVRLCTIAIKLSVRAYGLGSSEHIEVLINVAHFHEEEYNTQAALSYYLEALTAAERSKRTLTADYLSLLEATADIYLMNDDDQEAEDLYRREIAVARTMFGEDGAEVSFSLGQLATVLLKRGEVKRAEEVLLDSLERDRRRKEEGSRDQLRRLRLLGLAYDGEKDYLSAIRCYLRVEQGLKGLAEEEPILASVQSQLALMYRRTGEQEKAVERYQDQLAVVESYYGPESIYYAGVLQNLGETLVGMGKAPEAKPYLDRVKQLCQRYGYVRNPWV